MAFLFVDQNSSANPSELGQLDKITRRHINRHVNQYAYSRQGPWRRKKLPSRTSPVPVGWRLMPAGVKDSWDEEKTRSSQPRSQTLALSTQEQADHISSDLLSPTHIHLDGLRTDPFHSLPVSSDKFVLQALEQCETDDHPSTRSNN